MKFNYIWIHYLLVITSLVHNIHLLWDSLSHDCLIDLVYRNTFDNFRRILLVVFYDNKRHEYFRKGSYHHWWSFRAGQMLCEDAFGKRSEGKKCPSIYVIDN